MMTPIKQPLSNESGAAVLIATILILVVVTAIGLGAMNNSTMEMTIASNDTQHKMAFYNADSGVYGVPKLVSRVVNESQTIEIGAGSGRAEGLNYDLRGRTDDEAETDFYRQIMGFDLDTEAAITMQPGINTIINVSRIRQQIVAGGGAEFAAGTEGVGVGSQGGVAIFYQMDSRGFTGRGSNANVIADYRKVLGTAGGL
jgi:Tfp pilus assembly protein PilX